MEKTLPSKRGWVATNRLKRRPPFKGLFPIRQETMQAVAEHMEANGYDESAPIVVWDQTAGGDKHALVVLDGHTRLEAAKSINLSPVYVARMEFTDEEAALQYAIHNQRDRRNLTDADIMRCIEAVDKLKRQGERTDLASSDAKSGKSAEETAKVVGTSTRKVEKVRTITAHADEETKAAVVAGRKSINKAYQETQRERKPKERQADDTPVNFFPNLQPKPAPPPEPVKNPLEQVFDHLWAAWQVIEKEWPQGERREYPELRVRFGRGRSPDFRWDGDGLNGEQTTAVRVRILLSDIANHNEPFHDFLRDTVTTPPATTEAVMVTCQRNGGDQMALSHCLNECRHRAECSTVKAHIQ